MGSVWPRKVKLVSFHKKKTHTFRVYDGELVGRIRKLIACAATNCCKNSFLNDGACSPLAHTNHDTSVHIRGWHVLTLNRHLKTGRTRYEFIENILFSSLRLKRSI